MAFRCFFLLTLCSRVLLADTCHEDIVADVAGSPHAAGATCTLPNGDTGQLERVVHTVTWENSCTGAITSSEYAAQICVPEGDEPECRTDADCGAGGACQGGRCVQ